MNRPRSKFVATCAAAAFLLGACGSDDEDATNTDAPSAATSEDAGSTSVAPDSGDTTSSAPAQGSTDWDAVVAAANEEGAVVVYSGTDEPTNARIEAAFEAAYPEIDAEIIRLNSSEIVPRVDTERQTGAEGADVLSNTLALWLNDVADDGDLAEMTGPDFNAVLETTFAERPELGRDRHFATYVGGAWEIVWNTDLVDTPITGYADLVARADEFAGQIGMPDLYGDVVVEFYRNIQLGADGDVDPAESEMLAGLAALEPTLFESVVPLTNAVAAGELKAGIYSVAPVWKALAADGAPLAGTTDPEIPASANVYLAATSFGSHPNAAQVFTNFMFTPEGQTAATSNGYLSILEGIEGSGGGPDAMADPRPEMTDPDFVESFRQAWESLFR